MAPFSHSGSLTQRESKPVSEAGVMGARAAEEDQRAEPKTAAGLLDNTRLDIITDILQFKIFFFLDFRKERLHLRILQFQK